MGQVGNKCPLLVLIILVMLLAALVLPATAVKADGWYIQTVDYVGSSSESTSLALDNKGYPHISYCAYGDGYAGLKYASYNGTHWNIQAVDPEGEPEEEEVYRGKYSSLALDSTNGYPHISYSDFWNNDLKYASYNGTHWNIETVDHDGGVGWYTSLALDASDYPDITYYDASSEQALKYASYNGTDWNIETVDHDGDVGWYTSLALGASYDPHISYYDNDNDNLKYASFNGTDWNIKTVDQDGDVGKWTSLALDTINGYPHISYHRADFEFPVFDNRQLKYASYNGTHWNTETVDSFDPYGYGGTATSLALDSSSYPHISYSGHWPTLHLKYASYNGTAWNMETVDSAGNVGNFTSLALESSDCPHISYSGNDNLMYARLVASPTLSSVNPDQGYKGQTKRVTITGSNFYGVSAVSFGPGIAVDFTTDNSTQITATIAIAPDAALGIRDVSVTAAGGMVNLPNAFNVLQAIDLSKQADTDRSKAGDNVTYSVAITNTTASDTLITDNITDTLFGDITSHFSDDLAPGATDNISLTYTVKATDPDPLVNTVTVQYYPNGLPDDGISVSANCTVDLRHPDILVTKSAAPDIYKAGDNITYTATITNTSPDIILERTSANDSLVGNLTDDFPTSLDIGDSENVTYTYTVQATDPDPLVNLITVHYHPEWLLNDITDNTTCSVDLAPTIISVTPNEGTQGQTLDILITGSQLNRVNPVDFGPGIAVSFTTDNSTQITATLAIASDAAPGPRDVTVTNPGGSDNLTGGFTVQQPIRSGSVATATGTGTATFTTSSGSITGLTAIAQSALTCTGNPGTTFPHGFFSFNIINIAPGASVTITITLPSNMPAGTQYWKCQNGQWVNVTSLLGDNDGDNVLTLTLTDGGLGDGDGAANGTIVDPGGPAVVVTPATPQAPGRSSPPLSQPARRNAGAILSTKYLNVSAQQAAAGQPVTITSNVVNTGDEAGNYNVVLKINGQVEETRMVSVGPQGTQPVKFIVSKAQPGTYTVDIGGDRASFTVVGTGGRPSGSISNSLIVASAILVFVALFGLLAVIVRKRLQAY